MKLDIENIIKQESDEAFDKRVGIADATAIARLQARIFDAHDLPITGEFTAEKKKLLVENGFKIMEGENSEVR